MALLSEVVVLDLTDDLGEAAGRVLADLGAKVIKLEPAGGCASRHRGPFDDRGGSFHWAAWGRGKRSVVVDLEGDDAAPILRELLAAADILLESFTPTERSRLELDPGQVAKHAPHLIHVSVTPFGTTGPVAGAPATDITLSAAGGFLNHQGDKDRPPIPIGFPETASHGGVQAAADAIAALVERDRSGLGQHLDVSTQAAVVGTLLWSGSYAAIDRNPRFTGDDRGEAPSDRGGMVVPGIRNPVVEPCADGFVVMTYVLGAQGNAAFAATMRWVEEEGALDTDLCGRDWENWIKEMKAGDLPVADGARAMATLLCFVKTKTKAELHERSVRDKLLIAPCNNAADLLADSQLLARDFWVDVDGRKLPGPFARLSETPIEYHGGAPALGEGQVLLETTVPTVEPTPVAAFARGPIYAGLKVADLSWMAAGPLITRELANHGATVIHAETMARVDTMRRLPPYFGDEFTPETGLPAANANQSKLGLACNFALPEAREVVDRMIRWADVVLENFCPGVAARNGFGWERVHELNPRALMLSTSMRGQTGPEATGIGFGLQGAALAGYVDITGWPDRNPISPWGAYTDFVSPRYALAALQAALRHRDRTGVGQYVDLAQNEAGVHFLAPMILEHQATGALAERPGTRAEAGTPSGVYAGAGKERYIVVSALNDEHWSGLCRVVEPVAALAVESRFEQREEIEAVFAEWMSTLDVFDTADQLRAAGCPAYASLRPRDLLRDPQLVHRGFFTPLEHRVIEASYDGPVTLFSATPSAAWRAGPTIGEDNEQILGEMLGFSDAEIIELARANVLT